MADRPEAGGAAPLGGIAVIVTRARSQAEDLCERLDSLGARVVLSPSIRFEPPEDWAPADAALARASAYDWAIFTSVNGVAAVGRRLGELGRSWRDFEGVRLVPIGPSTAEALRASGLEPDRLPEPYQAEGILASLESEPLEGKTILLARAEKAREILPERLRERGARVDVVSVYRTLPAEPEPEAVEALRSRRGKSLVVTFTSSSTVEHFLARLPAEARAGLHAASVAAIGPITAETLRRHGFEPDILPEASTVPALVEALRIHFSAGPPSP